MKKKSVTQGTMLNLKGMLYLTAFTVWIFVIMDISDTLEFTKEAVLSYGGSTAVVIFIFYIIFLLLEFFVDVEDLD